MVETYILIFCFYILFSTLAWGDMLKGIHLTILFLPTYLIRYQLFNIPFTLLEGMIWILFVIWMINLIKDKRLDLKLTHWLKHKFKPEEEHFQHVDYNLIPHILRWPIMFMLLAVTVALFVSPDMTAAAGIWKAYFIEPVIFLLIFIYHIKNAKQINLAITNLAILSLIIFAYALIQKLTGWNINNLQWLAEETRRVTTFFGYPNANGLLLAPLGVIFLSYIWIKESIWTKIPKILAYIGIILTIIWAGSEGALFALALGSIIILLLKKHTSFITAVAVAIGIMIIILTPSLKTTMWQKITISDFSGQIRQAQWTETIDMLVDHPLRGGGLANYQNAIQPYHQPGITIDDQWQPVEIFLYPHNFLLNFWTELGILGLIGIVWLVAAVGIVLYRMFARLRKLPKYKQNIVYNMSLGLTAALTVIIVHGLVDVPYFKNDLSLLFWILIGIMIVLYNHTLEREAKE